MLTNRLRNCFYSHFVDDNLRPYIKWGLVAVALTISVDQAKAEYRVNVGDVLEVAVAGVPELRNRAPVQLDGSISLPLVGTLPVAGLPLPVVRAQIGAALASKTFRQRGPDGHETAIVIDEDEVTTSIAEYRPIYVDGDVSKPGEYAYRPAITARQVVALAGGYDIMHFRLNNPYLESADLRSQYRSLWTEFAQEQAHMLRIKNELGEGPQISSDALKNMPVSPSTISDIVKVEAEYSKAEQNDHQREKEFLQRSVQEGDNEVSVLSEQQKKEEEGYQTDLDELQKVLDLFSKGSLISPRVTDARRAVLLSSTRKLQTSAQLMQVKKQQDELTRKLERLDDQRRIDLLHEEQVVGAKLNEIHEKLKGVDAKLQYSAMVRSQLVQGDLNRPEIAIIRKDEKGRQRIVANEDTELQPGDTIEVALHYQDGLDSLPRKLSSSEMPAGVGPTNTTTDGSMRVGSR